MKSFLRLFFSVFGLIAAGILAYLLIFFAGLLALVWLGPIQALIAAVLAISLVITALIHWSEQKSFPFQ